MQLFLDNVTAPRSARIEQAGREATVYIYDVIGGDWGGVGARDFVPQLVALDVDTIHLRINSPGGDVFEGRTIATALAQHPAKVIAHIDGQAASAATYVALAADEVEIAEGGFFMIHNAWTIAIGARVTVSMLADTIGRFSVRCSDRRHERSTEAGSRRSSTLC